MQKEFLALKAAHRDYEKLNYPAFSLKTAKNYERECHSSNLKLFSESLKTARREKAIRLPAEETSCTSLEGKKVEHTRFAHKSLRALL
jgi:hypothetical protein